MKLIKVFSAEGCSQCNTTIRILKDCKNVEVQVIDIDKEEGMREQLRAKGLRSLPYVEVLKSDEVIDSWQGYSISKLSLLLNGK